MHWLQNSFEEWVYQETLRMNERGLPVDIPLVRKTLKFLYRYSAQRQEQCRALTGGINATQVKELTVWLNERVPTITDLKRVTLERVLRRETLDQDVVDVIRIRLEQGRVASKKLVKMLEMDSGDARMRGSFIYHGAGPGRFTATRLQPHNFVRPTIKEVDEVIELLETEQFDEIVRRYPGNAEQPISVLEAVGSCMRAMFTAPAGMLLVRADYNAIEARVLAWLTGEDDLTLKFHGGEDVYVDMAGYIFDEEPIIIRSGHKAEDIEYSAMRKLGKDTILGCGYQMWVKTFLMQMENKGEDNIAGIPIRLDPSKIGRTEEKYFNPAAWDMALKSVTGYRDKYEKIRTYWTVIDKAAKQAIRSPGSVYRVRGKIYFKYDGKVLRMMLPSGRIIRYPKARLEQVVKFDRIASQVVFQAVTEKGFVVDEYTYGGKLTENAVQGIARDLMCNGLWHSAKAGFENIGTVHDELIALCDESRYTDSLVSDYEKLICTLPDWAEGDRLEDTIPLTAEGKVGRRYGK